MKGLLMRPVEIHGYAIVSDDDRIADASGRTPDALRNEADWAYFQAELDLSALLVLGRLGHEAHPNRKSRPRMILSSSSPGLERRSDGWWWNPGAVSWTDAVRAVLPAGRRVAVSRGGGAVVPFPGIGYVAFSLTLDQGVPVPAGVGAFSRCVAGGSAEAVGLVK